MKHTDQGAGGNEYHSYYDVKTLHDGIVAGRWPPTLVVLPNGGFTWYYRLRGADMYRITHKIY